MNTQETKAVEEAADAQANKLRLYTSKCDFSRGFIAGAQFLDELRKVSKPDKGLLEALKKICKVAQSYIKNPDDELDNAICDAMLAVYDYELNEETK